MILFIFNDHGNTDEKDPQPQMRDVVLWGCGALFATAMAITTHFARPQVEERLLAADIPVKTDIIIAESKTIKTDIVVDETEPVSIKPLKTDNISTGSIRPQNPVDEKTESPSRRTPNIFPEDENPLNDNVVTTVVPASFGTTVARKQSNADQIRRMEPEEEATEDTVAMVAGSGTSSIKEQTSTIKQANTQEAVGIDLGVGHSFSSLGRRYMSMVNAAPTLFSKLEARASIVEVDSRIEAHLIAGPVADFATAHKLCSKIRQRVNTNCSPTKFSGRPLKLY